MKGKLAKALFATCALLVATPALVSSSDASAATPLVRSAGSLPVLPPGSRAIGALPGSTELSVDVALRPRDSAALDSLAQAVSTPGSPYFRQYLAPGEFQSVFGPTTSTVSSVRAWLEGAGLKVDPTTSDGLIVPVEGSAAEFADAFGIGFEQYELPTGRIARMPTSAPLVPSSIAGALTGVVGLDDLAQPEPQLVRASDLTGRSSFGASGTPRSAAPPTVAHGPLPLAARTSAGPQANCQGISAAGLSATQLAQAYSFTGIYGVGDEGQGTTVGIYELEPYLQNDVNTFEGCYTPAITASVSAISVNGANANANAGSGESALDIEMVVGMAPETQVKVYVGSDDGENTSNAVALSTYAAMVDQDQVNVISTSWGECERDLGVSQIQAEAALFAQAAVQGQTITAPGGDTGSEDCFGDGTADPQVLQVDDPASQPWVTSVGGTSLSSLGPPPTEAVWNDFFRAGGGGVSSEWTMPSWQVGPGVQNAYTSSSACPMSSGAGTGSCREVPDVAADADPLSSPFAVYVNGSWQGIGGTSVGSPLWAALAALADQGQSKTVGLMDPALYQAACKATPPFNDVSTGNNQLPAPDGPTDSNANALSGGPFYPATAHYDLASGLGTPVASSLVPDLRSPTVSCASAVPPRGYQSGDLTEFASDGANGRTWNPYDPSASAGGSGVAGSPSALVDPADGLIHVFVRGPANHLIEYVDDGLNGRLWNDYDLTAAYAGANPLGGDPDAVYDNAQGLVHVYAESASGHLVEYVNDGLNGNAWNAYDLSIGAGSGSPVLGTASAIYDSGQDLIHVYVESSAGHLVEYLSDHASGHVWNAYDLSLFAGGGSAVGGTPGAVYDAGQDLIHTYVQGSNGHLMEYVSDHASGHVWNAYDLTQFAGSGVPVFGTPSAVYDAGQDLIHTYVVSSSGHLVEYLSDHANGHVWNAYDLTEFAGNGSIVGGGPGAVYDPDQDLIHIYLRSANGHLVEYVSDHANGRVWNSYDLSEGASGPGVQGTPSPIALNNVIHVYAQGS